MNQALLEKFDIDLQNHAITFSCASDTPYQRYDQEHKVAYDEILIVNENAVDLSRLNNGAALLFNHDTDKLLGMVEQAWIAESRVYVRVRFSQNDEFAERIFKDILDGLIKGVSIGYQIEDYNDVKENGINKRYVTRWMIFQTSIVSIPADCSIGIRKLKIKETKSMENEEIKPELEKQVQEEQVEEVKSCEEQKTCSQDDEKIKALEAENEQLKEQVETLKRLCEEKPEQEQKASEQADNKEEIEKIAEDFNVPAQEVKSAIDKKLSVKQFKNIVKEKQFNIINKKETKNMNKREFSEYLRAGDFRNAFQLRDFTGFTDSDLIGTQTTPLVAALDKRMGVKGYRTIGGLHNNITIPVQSSRLEVAEKGMCDPAVDSNPAFGTVTLSPTKITGSVNICQEMLVNTNSDVESFIIDQLLKEISYKIEQKMLGAVASAAANTITYSSLDAITWADILAMEAALDGYLLNETAFVMNPAARAALKATPKATDAITGFICEGNEINGYRASITGVALNDNIYFGDWSELVLATWGESGINIIVDPFTESRAGNVVVCASALVDAAVVRPDAFCVGRVQDSSSSSSSGQE